jgi:hypothetical protein
MMTPFRPQQKFLSQGYTFIHSPLWLYIYS